MWISSLLLITMPLSLPDRALFVKLFYQNDNPAAVALRKFRTLKRMRKDPLTIKGLRTMVAKFEKKQVHLTFLLEEEESLFPQTE